MQKILIADDSEPMRRMHRDMAARSGRWRLCGEAVNGLQALHLARALRPDLVILDLAMPIMDGLRAAPEILKELPRVPIILYTLHEMPNLELEARKAGIRDVVVKGPDVSVLSNAIHRLLNESAQPAQPLVSAAALPDLFPQVVTEAARNEAAHAAVAAPPVPNAANEPALTRAEPPASVMGGSPISAAESASTTEDVS